MPLLESVTALAVVLGARVGKDIVTNIENRIINHVIDGISHRQQSSLTELEESIWALQAGQKDLLAGQAEFREFLRGQIEAHYKNGTDLLRSAHETGKRRQKIGFINDAIKEFITAKNTEYGEAAAKAALLVGACFHLLYDIDHKNGTRNENSWYDQAFRLAEKSLGPDRKPPRELMKQLLSLQHLSSQHGTFEAYWQKWEPPKNIDAQKDFVHRKLLEASKLSESPKVVDAPAIFDKEKYLQSHPRGLSREQRKILFIDAIISPSRLYACMKCGGPFSQQGDLQQLYCRKCRQKPWGK